MWLWRSLLPPSGSVLTWKDRSLKKSRMPLGRGLVDLCLEPYVVNYHVYFKEKVTIEAQGGASEQPNTNFSL